MSRAPSPRTQQLFEDARRVDLVDLVRRHVPKLYRSGAEFRSQCPICKAGAKSSTPPFAVNPAKRVWRCHQEEIGGDVIDLARYLAKVDTPKEAAAWLVGLDLDQLDNRPRQAEAPRPAPTPSAIAARIWAESVPAAGTIVEAYLAARRIPPGVIAAAVPQLRFHPRCPWEWDDQAKAWSIRAPAMVARVVTPAGPTGGVHCTYLAPDGSGKAALSPAKRMFGPQVDGEGRRGGALLIPPPPPPGRTALGLVRPREGSALFMAAQPRRCAGSDDVGLAGNCLACGAAAGDLCQMLAAAGSPPGVVCEGIETTLSLVAILARPVWAAAALSLGSLQGGVAKDEDGAIDVWAPKADPERPAFTWPAAGEVIVGVDHDMGTVRVKARNIRKRLVHFQLEATGRAELCGRMCKQAWAAAGAKTVRVLQPRLGADFNIVLCERSK